MEAAQLAEDLKVQLEHTQAKLKEIQVSVAENRTARERESSNLKRAQVCQKSLLTLCWDRTKSRSLMALFLMSSRRICPGWGGSWRNRKKWRCTLMLMRSCRKRSTSTRSEKEDIVENFSEYNNCPLGAKHLWKHQQHSGLVYSSVLQTKLQQSGEKVISSCRMKHLLNFLFYWLAVAARKWA